MVFGLLGQPSGKTQAFIKFPALAGNGIRGGKPGWPVRIHKNKFAIKRRKRASIGITRLADGCLKKSLFIKRRNAPQRPPSFSFPSNKKPIQMPTHDHTIPLNKKAIRCCQWVAFLIFLLPAQNIYAGAWTLPKGKIWIKMTGLAQTTQEEYVAVGGAGREPNRSQIYKTGDRARYRENGHYQSRALFFDLFYGLTHRFDLGIQIPYFHQTFENMGFRPANTASGFSDIRFFSKFNILQNPFLLTIKLGAKAPTGKFENQDGIIPVGEGQWDFDFITQIGRSFWPLPIYATLDLGYRLRLKNDTISRDPGDEWFYHAEIGYQPREKLRIAFKAEGIRGNASHIFNIEIPRDVKRITYFAPTLVIAPYQNLNLETTLRISAGGRNFPAGHMWAVGISYTGGLFFP